MNEINYLRKLPIVILLVSILSIAGCGGGTILLIVSDISGPGSLNENQVADYSVTVQNTTNLIYAWAVDPSSAGDFTNQTAATTTFHAVEVTVNTTVEISVSISGENVQTEVLSRDIIITDTNQAPVAAAHSDLDRIGHTQLVQFYDDSTDPEGDDDIIVWEWDFEYDGNAGFDPDTELREPRHQFDDPGTFQVQLRVTDTSGIVDMLDNALSIVVVENLAPEIIDVTHSRTTSEAGNEHEAVSLQVFFEDYSPTVGPHSINWFCDYGYFDDHTSPTPLWFPPDSALDCDITVEVLDEFGLSDSASVHQWVTGYPVINNSGVQGNIVVSQDLPSAFGGTVNPADYIFPTDTDDGKVIFMNFWASWCSNCLNGIPLLHGVYGVNAVDDDYMQLMVNLGDDQASVADFVNDNSYEGPHWLLDIDSGYFTFTNGWNSGSNDVPQSFVFDRDGRCRWAYDGQITWTIDLQLALEELL